MKLFKLLFGIFRIRAQIRAQIRALAAQMRKTSDVYHDMSIAVGTGKMQSNPIEWANYCRILQWVYHEFARKLEKLL
jgi:hypothetical protein